MKQSFAVLLSLIFCAHSPAQTVLDLKHIQEQYPNAQIKQVTVAELEEYKKLAAEDKLPEQSHPAPAPVPPAAAVSNPCGPRKKSEPEVPPPTGSVQASTDMPNLYLGNGNIFGGGGGRDDKAVLVVIAVIGLVVVAALVVYSIVYAIEEGANVFSCPAGNEFGLRYSFISDHSNSQARDGSLVGAFFTSRFRTSFGTMGLTGEGGYHSINLNASQSNIATEPDGSRILLGQSTAQKEFDGVYLMVGPNFTVDIDEGPLKDFQIELLAGTSSRSDIGTMSTLRMGLDFEISKNFLLGFNFGAALVQLKGFDNYLKDADQLNYLGGLSVTYRLP